MKKPVVKRILISVLAVLLAVLLVAVGYVAYVLIAYHRIEDNLTLEITDQTSASAAVNTEYTMMAYNIGFGAYSPDFSFFMDGGTESWAFSKDAVLQNVGGVCELLQKENPDFALFEEVDFNSTRSYHVDQSVMLRDAAVGYDSVFAQNYDSPFLFYPFTQPHGRSRSGIMTFSKFDITSATRRSLPIEDSLMKLIDLDRCYSTSRVTVENGKELVIYTVHLSAYTSDGTIAVDQIKMLIEDIKGEYAKGNYCICAGDFNKDLLGDSGSIFGISGEEYTWAKAFPTELLEGTGISLAAPFDPENPVPTCRNCDTPYNDQQFVVTVDGFLVTDNVKVTTSEVLDLGFLYSDHNPVKLTFSLVG